MTSLKRIVSILIPLKIESDQVKVYLQKRASNAKRAPNFFGFWGGGRENEETSEQTLAREVREELGINLDLERVKFFYTYEFYKSQMDVYYLEVEDGWENDVKISEGEYGQWFTVQEAKKRDDISFQDKTVLYNLEFELLKGNQ